MVSRESDRTRVRLLTHSSTVTTVARPLIGLASNLTTGWVAARWSLERLMCIAMLVLAAALLAFPFVHTLVEVYAYAATMGVAGGMVTVLFFAIWGQRFGPAHLGKIQGAAQMMTVLASAAGPLLLATSQRWTGSYVPLLQYAAARRGAWLGAAGRLLHAGARCRCLRRADERVP